MQRRACELRLKCVSRDAQNQDTMAEDYYRVEVRTTVDGQLRVRHADLIFRDEKPFVVLEWEGIDGTKKPSVVEEIEVDKLVKLNADSPLLPNYLYSGTVVGLDVD